MKAILGNKIGMTQFFDSVTGKVVPVTLVDVSENYLANIHKTDEKVTHIEIGKNKKKKVLKPEVGKYKALGFVPKHTKVLKVKDQEILNIEVGSKLSADIFEVGSKVRLTSTSKGKGFAGVMKRWNFKGGKRTHGQSDRERAPGSIGNRTIPGRVFKGKKMSGHMGFEKVTLKNVVVAAFNVEDSIISIKGAIPGPKGTLVVLKA